MPILLKMVKLFVEVLVNNIKNIHLLYYTKILKGTVISGVIGVIEGMRLNGFALSINMPLQQHKFHYPISTSTKYPL